MDILVLVDFSDLEVGKNNKVIWRVMSRKFYGVLNVRVAFSLLAVGQR